MKKRQTIVKLLCWKIVIILIITNLISCSGEQLCRNETNLSFCNNSDGTGPLNRSAPDEDWSNTFHSGLAGDYGYDQGYSVQQVDDGGFIIVGITKTYDSGIDNPDVWLIKTYKNGTKQWDRTFGGGGGDYGYTVKQTTDGGYIIHGTTSSFAGVSGSDNWLIKTDVNGSELWNKTYPHQVPAAYGYTDSVQQTSDSGYILLGDYKYRGHPYSRRMRLIKTDSNGSELWNRTYHGDVGEGGWTAGYSVLQTTDGGYAVTGFYKPEGDITNKINVWLIKTDSNGSEQWNRSIGGTYNDYGESLQELPDGGYIIVGKVQYDLSQNWLNDVLVIKTNKFGVTTDEWTFDEGGHDDMGRYVFQTKDNGFLITAITRMKNAYGSAYWNGWVIKTDSNLVQQWDKKIGGMYQMDYLQWGQQTNDGGYIIAGYTETYGTLGKSDVWLIKLQGIAADAHGSYKWVVNDPLQFKGSASGGVPPYTWHWDFGDGNTSQLQNPQHSYSQNGSFPVVLTVRDSQGFMGNDSTIAMIREFNQPPSSPVIVGPSSGNIGIEYTYTFTSTDPEIDDIFYHIDWGDGIDTGWIGPVCSGEQLTQSHAWNATGNYTITALVKDDPFHNLSEPSTHEMIITNRPPNKPNIQGTSHGKAGESYEYSFLVVDPDADDVEIFIDWEDDTNTNWYGPFRSGEEFTINHTWLKKDTYTIRAKARDMHGSEGEESILEVEMPQVTISWRIRFFERIADHFPILAKFFTIIIFRIGG